MKVPVSPFTCLKISSKVGLLFGSSLQACLTICITSSGASSTDSSGRHSGGGSLTLLIISARTQKTVQNKIRERSTQYTQLQQRRCVSLRKGSYGHCAFVCKAKDPQTTRTFRLGEILSTPPVIRLPPEQCRKKHLWHLHFELCSNCSHGVTDP